LLRRVWCEHPARRFSTFAPRFTPNRATKTTWFPNKTIDKTLPLTSRETSATFSGDHATQNIAIGSQIETRARFLRAPPLAIAVAEFHIGNDGNRENPCFPGSSSSSSGTKNIGAHHTA